MTEAEELGVELADFRRRVAELRSARALPQPEQFPALDAALLELQHAAEVLWPRYEQLVAELRNGSKRGDQHEQQLLRALFQRLPVPTVLLDRDTVVRRLNVAATQLFGMRAGYATGRSLVTSLARDGRAAFRSQVAAVARGEGERSLVVRLLRPPEVSARDGGTLRATLSALRPPQEPRSAVLAVFQRAADTLPARPAAATAPTERVGPRSDPAEVTRQTELLDLVDEMAATLLTCRDSGPSDVAEVARWLADVLCARFADWVIVDLVLDGELRRVRVSGPDPEARKAVLVQEPGDCPLVVDAVRHGTETLQVRPEDQGVLGRDSTGVPVLVRLGASSLMCVPLVAGGGEGAPALGALTVLRSGGRRVFELAEAGVADRMARHIALALRGLL